MFPFLLNLLAAIFCALIGIIIFKNESYVGACFQFFLCGVNLATAVWVVINNLTNKD